MIDYTREDFIQDGQPYDVVFDVAGSRSWRELMRVLTPRGTLIQAGAPMAGRVLGPLRHIAATRVASLVGRRRAVFFLARFNRPDMEALRQLIDDEEVRPVVERTHRLDEVAEALRYAGEGHARGKIVLSI